MSRVDVYQGDSREILKVIPDASIDGVVTDPPYALVSIRKRFAGDGAAPHRTDGPYARASSGFMGEAWDTGETAFAVEFWREVWRVVKPGGWVVAFGGTRTYHRLACAVEDAGFEIRDMIADLMSVDPQVQAFADSLTPVQRSLFAKLLHESPYGGMLAWIYGTGFPKAKDASKSVDDWLGAEGGFGEAKSAAHAGWIGRGRLRGEGGHDGFQRPWMDDEAAVDRAAREYVPATDEARAWDGWATALKPGLEPMVLARKPLIGSLARNLLAHGTGALNVDACRLANERAGETVARAGKPDREDGWGLGRSGPWVFTHQGRWPANVVHDGSDEVAAAFPASEGQRGRVSGEEPSAAFGNIYNPMQRGPTAEPRGDSGSAARFFYSAKADDEDRLGSDHPTVKPVDLMAWLVRLIVRRGGVVLDPFAGSGTTGLAALREGVDAILIERESDHADDIRRRIAWAQGQGRLTAQEKLTAKLRKDPAKAAGEGTPLFGGGADE